MLVFCGATLSHGFAAGSPVGAVSFTYGYDASGRVSSIGNTQPQAFEWQPTLGYARTYGAVNNLNQVASETQGSMTRANAFDADGNLTSDGVNTYVYTYGNRLVGASRPGMTATYAYDGDDRRTVKIVNGVMTRTLWSGADEVAELDASGAVLRRFIPDGTGAMDRRVAQVSSAGAVSWFHTDHQGSVIAVTNAAGHATATASYSPYGEFATPGQMPPGLGAGGGVFGYTGRQFDAETGLYQYRARYYHPRLGQFLSTDPIGTKDDPNLTLYVRLDPVNLTDPTGMCIGATIRICQEIARRAAPVIARAGNAVSRHLPGTTQHAAAAQQRLQAANLARHPAYQLVLNRGDQGKHIVGSRNYDPSGTRSILTANPQRMFDRLGGTGSSVNQVQRGSDRFRERVEANGIIGQYYDQATRAFVPTDRALIHYGRDGWHIVPARPSGNMMNLINEAVF